MCALVTGVQTCALPISREGDGEWARNEPSHIDQDRSAMPCLDRELEAEHRIGLHGLRRDRRESDRPALAGMPAHAPRSEEHTSELQSLMRISYAVFCLKKKKKRQRTYEKNNKHSTKKKSSRRDRHR